MKKIFKRILIIIGFIISVLLLAFGGMALKMRSELSGFAPLETGRVVDYIFVVKDDFANLFIIQDDTQYIVIDCANNQATVAEQMKKLEINPTEVTAVFLTHTDGDHVGAPGLFDKARLYMSKEEEQMDTPQATASMEIIRRIPFTKYIFTSHWGFTDDYPSAIRNLS